VRIELHTGRKHQIRAQLSAIGCPIVGDVKYGASAALPDQSISLKAVELGFVHPVTKEQIIIKV
jgi:23S rRNA pseudouridine1911/1915/1917 synthase